MTTATHIITRPSDSVLQSCRSDISTARTSAGSYVQSPLVAVVRPSVVCAVKSCGRSAHTLNGGRRGYCQAHAKRLNVRGRLDEDEPIRAYATRTPVLPLTDDIDEIAVERAARGERLPLTGAERLYVTAQMTNAGRSAEDIAAVLGVCARTVVRWRNRIRAAS